MGYAYHGFGIVITDEGKLAVQSDLIEPGTEFTHLALAMHAIDLIEVWR